MSVERVFGVDSRVQVSPKTSPPYKWICFLQVSFGNESFRGTGFAINMPLINRKMIVTSGHLVFNRSYANAMRVTFPGEAPVQVTRDDLWAPPEYVNSHDQNYDYGLILLPGQSDEGFGWSTLIPDDELHHRLVSICGFPGDKEENTMWISGGRIESSDQHLLYYEIDTMAGMSGSPVYTWHKGYWTVVGIHGCCQSGPSNQANRLLSSMIFTMLGKAGGPKKFALQSEAFPNVYMRCNASGFTAHSGSGGGEVNCQYGPPREWEIFYFCPMEVAPSLAPQSRESYVVALRNVFWNSTWVRMDSQGMDRPAGPGGGQVNCQHASTEAKRWEAFTIKAQERGVSFQSLQWPNIYIRMDGGSVHQYTESGGGMVNCQYYNSPYDVKSWECFTCHEQN